MASNPTLLVQPIAENGAKNAIPATTITPGAMSQDQGFPAETSLPLGAGGVAPDRLDFNGVFNLLGGIAFMAQKGFTFNYDATQDYYAGCVVMDGGNRYLCIADMAAGTIAPSADTTGDYWIFYPVGVINKRDVITTSGTYTAPVTGWYKITVKGGGAGGRGGETTAYVGIGGDGGGGGGTTIAYEKMTTGDTATVVIGAGGAGGAVGGGVGGNGGNSFVVVNGNTYTGGGGVGTGGGTGTIPGAPGSARSQAYHASQIGGAGGGAGGGVGGGGAGGAGVDGGGGAGGYATYNSTAYKGGAGGNGFVWFEYFAAI